MRGVLMPTHPWGGSENSPGSQSLFTVGFGGDQESHDLDAVTTEASRQDAGSKANTLPPAGPAAERETCMVTSQSILGVARGGQARAGERAGR